MNDSTDDRLQARCPALIRDESLLPKVSRPACAGNAHLAHESLHDPGTIGPDDRNGDILITAITLARASPRVLSLLMGPLSMLARCAEQYRNRFWRSMMSEALQWSAAIVVLVAYALSLKGTWSVRSYHYLVANFIGGFGLSAAAAISHQWGFVLLEGVWGAVAGWSILTRIRGGEIRVPANLES
jgi:hypothetical protein